MEWQPIETAPKDGSLILAFERGFEVPFMDIVRWGAIDKRRDGWIDMEGAWSCDATHWMPLPEPPNGA